jgi:ribosomal protein S18 acetylase RimI-like enzyme
MERQKRVCYLTPTNIINTIPVLSLNVYYINNFCVDKAYRRQGYGSEMLTKIIQKSKKEEGSFNITSQR